MEKPSFGMMVGMFGAGAGIFDANISAKTAAHINEQVKYAGGVPLRSPKKNPSLLGDFTMHRVNKEFENF